MNEFWQRLKQRMIVQWAIAYAAFWFAFLQGIDIVAQRFDWPNSIERVFILALVIGFCVALVLAWYHGERGVQRIRGIELLILALLLAIGGALTWRFGPEAAPRGQVPALATTSGAHASSAATVPERIAAQPAPAKSIAVLPFENLSDDKQNQYFVAGMQDMILTRLAGIGELKVISRTSTAKYASRPDDLKTIARQLGVATIVEGSVQKTGKQVLVSVQLIDAQTDSHLWAESYTRTLDNVFGVEGEVAKKIAAALKARLSGPEAASLTMLATSNRAAMDLFLRAEYEVHKGDTNFDTTSWKAAIPLYRQAVEQDPEFAWAWARLSYAESGLAWFGGDGLDVNQLYRQAGADAERALKLQPELSAAHVAVGFDDFLDRGDYPGALRAFAEALRLKPNDADAMTARGFVERRQGRFDTALASLHEAFALDPRNSITAFEIAGTCMMLGRYREGESWAQRAMALDPENLNARTLDGYAILLGSGDVLRAMQQVRGDEPVLKLARITLLTYQRKYSEASLLLQGMRQTPASLQPGRNVPKALLQANLYRLMGEPDRARPLFERAVAAGQARLPAQQGINLAVVWRNLADAELGLGRTQDGLAAIAEALAIVDKSGDAFRGPVLEYELAALYARAGRADLAVPLLAKALASPGSGALYSPVLLWLDPAWDPIRKHPRFQVLLKEHAEHRPAITYDIASARSAAASASAR